MEPIPGVKLLSTPAAPKFDEAKAHGSLQALPNGMLVWTSAADGQTVDVPLVGSSESRITRSST